MNVNHVHPRNIPDREELLRSMNRSCLLALRARRAALEQPDGAVGRKAEMPL